MTKNNHKPRLRRCVLSVPANRPRFIKRAATSDADAVLLDLEDSIPATEKAAARQDAVQAINEVDWRDKTLSVRINSPDSPHMHRDVIEIASACSRLDSMMVPKVECGADVHALDMLLRQVGGASMREREIGLELIVETAVGVTNVDQIAAHSPRTEAILFGLADFAASIGARTTAIGAPLGDYTVLSEPGDVTDRQAYLNDAWHYPRSKILIACRANGLQAIDGAYGRIADSEGLQSAAKMASSVGYDGKLAVHPDQISTIINAFVPGDTEVESARRIVDAMQKAGGEGAGSALIDGKMIDAASVRMAERVLALSGKR